jgi:hypothetical protein
MFNRLLPYPNEASSCLKPSYVGKNKPALRTVAKYGMFKIDKTLLTDINMIC